MEEKWGIDFKKFKKNSSRKLIKGGLGLFLSPREEIREDGISSNLPLPAFKRTSHLDTEGLNQEETRGDVRHPKDYMDDIPVIPSLDDFVDEDLANQIIKAPLIGVKQVASYKDLENDLLRHSAFGSLEEVNLQILIKLLHSESSLDEPDIPWTKDSVFTEMQESMKTRKHYLIVDTKNYRRHSAPENLGSWFTPKGRQSLPEKSDQCRASVSDFSVLLENQSESGSSLELDTSNWSRDLSTDANTKTTPTDSYQNLPTVDVQRIAKSSEDSHSRGHSSWSMWKNILLSQAIAGCMAVADMSNASLKRDSNSFMANGQNFPHYIFLGVCWTTRLALRNDGRDIVQVIKFSGLRYLFLSVLHVEANYLLVSCFRLNTYLGNQTINSVAAILCLAIAYVCLEVRFRSVHTSGFAMSLLGSLGLCVANVIRGNSDLLRIASGICLAFNSIAQEIIIKSIDYVEYLGMVGLMGSIICGFQAMTLESLETDQAVPRTFSYWFALSGYSVAQFSFYSLTPKVLHEMGSTGLHLALTTSALYSYFIGGIYHFDKWDTLSLIFYGVIFAGNILFFSKRTVTGMESFFPVKIIITKGI